MKGIQYLAGSVLAIALSLSIVHASDAVGVYALIDKVVMEPNSEAPERIQIWGVFALAKKNNANDYEEPARGYLYFTLQKGKEQICRKEWADLKKVAATKQAVAFGSRWELKARIRKAEEKADSPDVYPVSFGLVKVRTDTNYSPIRALLAHAAH
ncbi:MAG TPA: hypothetical protein VGL91_16125 [Acidobacteriota bacterium]|jgi:hypothetical protein